MNALVSKESEVTHWCKSETNKADKGQISTAKKTLYSMYLAVANWGQNIKIK